MFKIYFLTTIKSVTAYKAELRSYVLIFFIIPVYLQSVQVHSVNWLEEVDECLGEGRSLAPFCSWDRVRCPL
jgi:hypothetical protein